MGICDRIHRNKKVYYKSKRGKRGKLGTIVRVYMVKRHFQIRTELYGFGGKIRTELYSF